MTGSNQQGRLYGGLRSTCQDWTSKVGSDGKPRVGMSWPRNIRGGFPGGGPGGGMRGDHWMADHDEAGCADSFSILQTGPGLPGSVGVGSGGGYGGIYCFALTL